MITETKEGDSTLGAVDKSTASTWETLSGRSKYASCSKKHKFRGRSWVFLFWTEQLKGVNVISFMPFLRHAS